MRNDSSWLPAVVVCGATIGVLLGLDFEALLTALRRFRSLAFIALGTAVAQVVAIGFGALANVGWRGFLALQTAALVGGAIPVVVLGLRAMASTPKVPVSPENRRSFNVYARQQALRLVLTTVLWGRPELLFLEAYRSSSEVGLYNAALRLASIAAMLPLVSTRSLVPEFAYLRGAGRDEALRSAYPRICLLLAVLSAPLALGGAAIAAPLVTAFFGSEFSGAGVAAQILLAGSLVNALQGPASAAALTGPRPRFTIEVGIVAAVANLALAALLIGPFGIEAAAGVNVAVQLAAVVAGITYARIRLDLRYPVLKVSSVVLQAGIAACAAWAITRAISGSLGLVIGVATASVVYVALIIGTGTVTRAELRSLVRPTPPSSETVSP